MLVQQTKRNSIVYDVSDVHDIYDVDVCLPKNIPLASCLQRKDVE